MAICHQETWMKFETQAISQSCQWLAASLHAHSAAVVAAAVCHVVTAACNAVAGCWTGKRLACCPECMRVTHFGQQTLHGSQMSMPPADPRDLDCQEWPSNHSAAPA